MSKEKTNTADNGMQISLEKRVDGQTALFNYEGQNALKISLTTSEGHTGQFYLPLGSVSPESENQAVDLLKKDSLTEADFVLALQFLCLDDPENNRRPVPIVDIGNEKSKEIHSIEESGIEPTQFLSIIAALLNENTIEKPEALLNPKTHLPAVQLLDAFRRLSPDTEGADVSKENIVEALTAIQGSPPEQKEVNALLLKLNGEDKETMRAVIETQIETLETVADLQEKAKTGMREAKIWAAIDASVGISYHVLAITLGAHPATYTMAALVGPLKVAATAIEILKAQQSEILETGENTVESGNKVLTMSLREAVVSLAPVAAFLPVPEEMRVPLVAGMLALSGAALAFDIGSELKQAIENCNSLDKEKYSYLGDTGLWGRLGIAATGFVSGGATLAASFNVDDEETRQKMQMAGTVLMASSLFGGGSLAAEHLKNKFHAHGHKPENDDQEKQLNGVPDQTVQEPYSLGWAERIFQTAMIMRSTLATTTSLIKLLGGHSVSHLASEIMGGIFHASVGTTDGARPFSYEEHYERYKKQHEGTVFSDKHPEDAQNKLKEYQQSRTARTVIKTEEGLKKMGSFVARCGQEKTNNEQRAI
jgi:hypothetical protein